LYLEAQNTRRWLMLVGDGTAATIDNNIKCTHNMC
jgi:hypothetical protein